VLGRDVDGAKFARLTAALKRTGFTMDPSWNPADLDRFPFSSAAGTIIVDAEASDGLVVTGDAALVSKLRGAYAQP
jgi:hypothetical protein